MSEGNPKIIDGWLEANNDLGLNVVGPIEISLSDKLSIQAEMLVPDFGGPKGTIVVTDYWAIEPKVKQIREAGYFVSAFAVPVKRYEYNRERVIEVLKDWGWFGPEDRKPSWLS